MSFEIGDRVKVVRVIEEDGYYYDVSQHVGGEYTVVEIDIDEPVYGLEVGETTPTYFYTEELEAVND